MFSFRAYMERNCDSLRKQQTLSHLQAGFFYLCLHGLGVEVSVTSAHSLPFPLPAPCPNTLASLQHEQHLMVPAEATGRGLSRP